MIWHTLPEQSEEQEYAEEVKYALRDFDGIAEEAEALWQAIIDVVDERHYKLLGRLMDDLCWAHDGAIGERIVVYPFEARCSMKAQAKKVLEEACELYCAAVEGVGSVEEEAADLVTATTNLVGKQHDLPQEAINEAMELVRIKNETRGRYR